MEAIDSMSSNSRSEVHTLANGLRVVLVPCEADSVAVGVFIASGSRHEPPRFAGISHLIEHMLFKGTPTRRSIDISREIEGRGGRFNAMTGEETTIYYAHMPDDYLADAVDVLSDMYLHATVPDDEFDSGEALALVERAFRPLKRAKSQAAAALPRLPRHTPSLVSVEKDVQQTQLALGFRTFGISDPRRYAMTVVDAVLGRGMSSRLFQEVREKRGFSYDIASRVTFFEDAGMFTVSAGLDPAKAERVVATIDKELVRICERRVSPAELRRTKDFLIGNFKLSHESVMGKLLFYGSMMLSFGRDSSPAEQIAGIRAVTAEDVQAVARTVLSPKGRSVSWVVPRGVQTGKGTRP